MLFSKNSAKSKILQLTFELDNVELNFKTKRVLSGIYLKAETGKVTAILGRNGSGKSCLLDIAFGNLRPKYMLLRINNLPILKPLYKTKLVAYLPQYNFIPRDLKLRFVFKLFNVIWHDFIVAFEDFSKYSNAKFNALSGGEQRLVETYIILKTKSEMVILDEPFSHLAPLYISKITALISEEKQQKAILVSDHMHKHILTVSDHIYLLQNGTTKLIESLTELEDYNYLSEGTLSNDGKC